MTAGGAGLPRWLMQRATAVYMLFFLAYLLAHFAFDPPASYLAWRGWIASPGMSVATGAFFFALLAHTWVGVGDVILDYVRPARARGPVLAMLSVALLAIAAWLAQIFMQSRG